MIRRSIRWAFWTVASLFLGVVSARAEMRTIEVAVASERSVDPDIITMNVEIWSKAATAARAQQLAAEKTKDVQAALDQYKIRKEDVQTQAYSFGPEYVWEPKTGQNRLTGFRSTQTLHVTLRATAQAGKFVDVLTQSEKGGGPRAEAGVNLNNIQWDSSKREDLATAGLADAVKLARKKADEIAKAAGVQIKGVSRITHQADEQAPAPHPFRGGAKAMAMAADASATALAEGQIKVRVGVSVEYEISN